MSNRDGNYHVARCSVAVVKSSALNNRVVMRDGLGEKPDEHAEPECDRVSADFLKNIPMGMEECCPTRRLSAQTRWFNAVCLENVGV